MSGRFEVRAEIEDRMDPSAGLRLFVVRVTEPGGDASTAGCRIVQFGDVAIVHDVQGRDFWRAVPDVVERLREEGITRAEGYMTDRYASMMQASLDKVGIPSAQLHFGPSPDLAVWVVAYLDLKR